MSATFTCPNCGAEGSTTGEIPRGAKVRCKACHSVFAPEAVLAAFATLGLTSHATVQEIRQAYRDLAEVWHPDRFFHNPRIRAEAESKMVAINSAYQLLRDYLRGSDQSRQARENTASAEKDDEEDAYMRDFMADLANAKKRQSAKEAAQHKSRKGKQAPQGRPSRPVAKQTQPHKSDSLTETQSSAVPWYKDPILKFSWIISVAILVPFLIYLARHQIFYVGSRIGGVLRYMEEHVLWFIQWFVFVPLGVAAALVGIFYWVKEDLRKQALSTKCPLCGKLSAVRYVGENILSQTPKVKTVTRRSTGVAMFDGQFIPTIGSQRVQVIVYDVSYTSRYICKFCNEESVSLPMEREIEP